MTAPSTGTAVARPPRSAVERNREAFVRYPDEPVDAARVAAVFERAGLPGRLD